MAGVGNREWVARIEGKAGTVLIPLNPTRVYTVGSDPENDIPMNDPEVSPRHCLLAHHGGSWRVVDTGSRDGIFVNGDFIRDHILEDGDRIHLSRGVGIRMVAPAGSGEPVPRARHSGEQPPAPGAMVPPPAASPGALPSPRRKKRILLRIVLVAAGGLGVLGYLEHDRWAPLWMEILGGSRFVGVGFEERLAALERLRLAPDPAATADVISLDREVQEMAPAGVLGVLERHRLTGAVLETLLATAKSGDDRALDAVVERAARPG